MNLHVFMKVYEKGNLVTSLIKAGFITMEDQHPQYMNHMKISYSMNKILCFGLFVYEIAFPT